MDIASGIIERLLQERKEKALDRSPFRTRSLGPLTTFRRRRLLPTADATVETCKALALAIHVKSLGIGKKIGKDRRLKPRPKPFTFTIRFGARIQSFSYLLTRDVILCEITHN